MHNACNYHFCMNSMIQIRNVPPQLHRRLKAKAALSGQSLSNYLLGEIRRIAERPTEEELLERLHRRKPVTPGVPPADAVRSERDTR